MTVLTPLPECPSRQLDHFALRAFARVGRITALLSLIAGSLLASDAAGPPTLLFQEAFEDSTFAARGWYDSDATVALSSVEHIPGSTKSYEAHFGIGDTTPATPRRHAFAETDSVYISFWVKFSSNWIGSGKPYHPHFMHLLTNENSAYSGLAWTPYGKDIQAT